MPCMLVLVVLVTISLRGCAAATAATTTTGKLPRAAVSLVTRALQNHGTSPGHGNGNTFFTASLLMPYLSSVTRPPTTLLIPTDAALMRIAATAASDSFFVKNAPHLRSLAKLHMLTTNLTFAGLQILPNSTYLPTLLNYDPTRTGTGTGTGTVTGLVHVTTNARGDRIFINGARVVSKDLCPRSVSRFLTCHGVDRLLVLKDSVIDDHVTPAAPSPARSYNVTAVPPPIVPPTNADNRSSLSELPHATVSAAAAPKPVNLSSGTGAVSAAPVSVTMPFGTSIFCLASSGLLLLLHLTSGHM